MTNRLASETSPYLRQHAHNPVHWQPWDQAALLRARSENKPILLSIGYSACHWCHVMAHESFEDPAVAEVMNRLFVNIKVDREERPDLDQIYQLAHQFITRRSGGWPLTMFLTPDGTPYFGGTYFPKTPRYGLPGFPQLCEQVAQAFYTRRGDIDEQNTSLREALASVIPNGAGVAELDAAPLQTARQLLLDNFDAAWGGFGGAPKFPHPTDLAFLLRRAAPGQDEAARKVVLTTLTRMAEGGIYDRIGGGFCRYSVDERWEIPHFEKMLYDNGPLLVLYADAWLLEGDPLYRSVVEETAVWVMREMQSPDGGYYSSLDADSEGEEGKYYVWDRAEIQALLSSDEWRAAARCWGLDRAPNFEGQHWNLIAAQAPTASEVPLLTAARARLFAARGQRVRPGTDDKILTSWNALMIRGMAHAARIFSRDEWLCSAQRATDFIRTTLWRDEYLLATYKDGKAHLNAYLDDHAFLIDALLELMQTEYRPADLDFARELADALLERFEDRTEGGFFFTSHDHEQLISRPKPGHDNATPSGNGVAAHALQRLGHLLGEPRYLEAARRALDLFWPGIQAGPSGSSSLLAALEEALTPPRTIVLRGPEEALRDWRHRLSAMPLHDSLIVVLPNSLMQLPDALNKPRTDEVNVWVCEGVNCLSPITSFDVLQATISKSPKVN
ncbi:thioredoxin domain-containing protein [Georgfuchsia toluolica]|nr:thioredoxin domain-containing protein [Georgfuchsia toluolica]